MRLFTAFLTGFLVLLAFMPSGWSNERNFAGKSTPATNVSSGGSAAQVWLNYYKGLNKDVNYKNISAFIRKYPDFPAMDKLREQAEQAMPGIMPDQEVLEWFAANPPQTSFGMKMYSATLIRVGQKDKAHKEINEWWRTKSLSADDQRKGYSTFANYLDKSAHADRLRRLIHKGQYTNARKIADILGAPYQALTEARIALRSGQGNADSYISRVPASLQNDEGLLYDRLVFRRKKDNNAGAIEILNRAPSSDEMYNAEDWGKERGIIARRLFEEGKYSAAYKLTANHKIKDGPGFATNEWMAGWIALEYLNKPWESFEHFERLYHKVETPISKSRAAYWAGLASERLNHKEIAVKWYDVGSKYPTTFYGQLSLEKLGRPTNIQNASVPSDAGMKHSALAKAAIWLKNNGYKSEAGMFLNKMIDVAKTPGEYAAVAEVSNDLWMKNFAIKAAQESEKKTGVTMVSYAFPKIEKFMGGVEPEWALVHALVRQESRYDAAAVSSAGARGLMQLMPATAKEVAKKAGLSHNTDMLISNPQHNVNLGSRFLEKLLVQYDGNYAMALAAYNAGPGRVNRWINEIGDPRDPKVDLVNWIEMIPIYETRNYVQRVLEGVYVYRQTLSTNKNRSNGNLHLASQ